MGDTLCAVFASCRDKERPEAPKKTSDVPTRRFHAMERLLPRFQTRIETSLKTRHQTLFVEDKKAPDGHFRRRGEARRRFTAPER